MYRVGCTMMGRGGGVGEGCCSEVLWDTRLYHDGGGGGGCCSEVLWDTRLYHDSEGVGGGGGGGGTVCHPGYV